MPTKILTTIAALGLATTGANALDGAYLVSGTNLDGSAYEGMAEITLTSQTTCTIEWKTGSTTSGGICMRNGNAFSAAYMLNDEVGLVIYLIRDDGILEGHWTISGLEGSGAETLTPQ